MQVNINNYYNDIVNKFNAKQSVVLKKQFIEKYIQHIMNTINKGRGHVITRRHVTRNKRGKTKRKGFKY